MYFVFVYVIGNMELIINDIGKKKERKKKKMFLILCMCYVINVFKKLVF